MAASAVNPLNSAADAPQGRGHILKGFATSSLMIDPNPTRVTKTRCPRIRTSSIWSCNTPLPYNTNRGDRYLVFGAFGLFGDFHLFELFDMFGVSHHFEFLGGFGDSGGFHDSVNCPWFVNRGSRIETQITNHKSRTRNNGLMTNNNIVYRCGGGSVACSVTSVNARIGRPAPPVPT